MKINFANSWWLEDCCQLPNTSIDFVKYLTASDSNVNTAIFTRISYLQYLGCFPHLSESFEENWIEIHGPVNQPPISPDPKPPEFFLGNVKN